MRIAFFLSPKCFMERSPLWYYWYDGSLWSRNSRADLISPHFSGSMCISAETYLLGKLQKYQLKSFAAQRKIQVCSFYGKIKMVVVFFLLLNNSKVCSIKITHYNKITTTEIVFSVKIQQECSVLKGQWGLLKLKQICKKLKNQNTN